MRRVGFLFGSIFMCGLCTAQVMVQLKNSLEIPRSRETVEIRWLDLIRVGAFHPDSMLVLDDQGQLIPSQVIYAGKTEPQMLIFQVDIPPKGVVEFRIGKGQPQSCSSLVYGRFVPERMDDYAWENNRIAFRLYGPSLKDPISPGVDVWVKSTHELIINKWYAGKQYHKNSGEGMDCYKVGKTLGAGACAILNRDTLVLGGNFSAWKTLDNGPIRTTVQLTYPPVFAEGVPMTLQKTISLDANSYLNKMENIYTGNFDRQEVVAGIALHKVVEQDTGMETVWIREEPSDSRQPLIDGDLFLAVVFPGAQKVSEIQHHFLLHAYVCPGQKFTYWSGAAWVQGGVSDTKLWKDYVESGLKKIKTPIEIRLYKK